MVSPTHAGLSGHCSVRRIGWCSFCFSGGVGGCWCSCSVYCFFIISFFIDTLCTIFTPVIEPTSPECALAAGSK